MSDVSIEVINPDTTEGLFGIVLENIPYLYWLQVYKELGLTPNHARKVLERLTPGTHYISFLKSEFKQKYPTVYKSYTLDKRASSVVFLTAEGYHRAIIEIQTGYMDNPFIADLINQKKDHIAHIYTRYQRGELQQIAPPNIKQIEEKRKEGTTLNKEVARLVKEKLIPEYSRIGLNPKSAFSREHRAINIITNGEHEADLKNKLNSSGLDIHSASKISEIALLEANLLDDDTRWNITGGIIDRMYPNRHEEQIKLSEREISLIKRGCTENQKAISDFTAVA